MMKRGFFNWDKGEISEQVFEQRKKKALDKMKAEDLHYLLIHGDIYQCDNVQFLCNFNTYTRDCLLILNRDGELSLVSGLTFRDRKWIDTVTPVESERIFFGIGLLKSAEVLKTGGFSSGKLGLVGDFFPRVTLAHLKKEFPQAEFVDLTGWYRNLRRVKDSAEKNQIKMAALLALQGAKTLDSPDVFGTSEIDASARAEWVVRSRGGEDFFMFCSSGSKGYLDFPAGVSVVDRFAFSILAQYKGCWATLQRTLGSMDGKEREKDDFEAYASLKSYVQAESSLEGLTQCIERARSQGWQVEIKAPIGQDTTSSVVASMGRIPKENDSVFSLSFRKETGAGLFTYGETIYIGSEGYDVWTQ